MGFSYTWVDRIMQFTSSVSYSVVVNSLVSESFITRGLKQGDPLSVYLFLICGERLSALLRMGGLHGTINAPRITHFYLPVIV